MPYQIGEHNEEYTLNKKNVEEINHQLPSSNKWDAITLILFVLLVVVSAVAVYQFATTTPPKVCTTCADVNTSAQNIMLASAYQRGYVKGINDIQNATLLYGYNRGISDTQNATLLLGYCSAQQELVKTGVMAINNTVLVIPISTLKAICFQ